MLLTDKMEGPLLLDPALTNGLQCDKLRIITGYADCERMSTHLIALHDGLSRDNKLYVSGIRIEIILGMVKGTGLTRKKHQKICQTIKRLQSMHGMPKISCRYIVAGKEVHSKVYVWLRGSVPTVAYCGSVNYTINAFRKRRECMNECNAEDAHKYFRLLKKDTLDCFDPQIEEKLHFVEASAADEDTDNYNIENLRYEDYADRTPLDSIRVSLLTAAGKVGHGSGINWGIRPNGTPRNPNQAYIPYNKQDKKAGFFPERENPTDKNCPLFKVITRETGAFYMRLAQERDKGIQSAESNAIIGKWLREKIGVPDGTFITLEMLQQYGATSVVFKKYENSIYVLEFDPMHQNQ